MRTTRGLLALLFSAMVAMAMVVPASADTTGAVDITGTIPSTLSIALGPASIGFPSLALGACNPASNYLTVTVNSNTSWGETVTVSSTGTNKLAVSKLYWIESTTSPNCGLTQTPGKAFASGSNVWYGPGTQPATGTSGVTRNMAFALKLDAFETGGGFNFHLVYEVTQ